MYEKYNDQLVIAYANDLENNIRALSHDDLKSLSITEESVKTIASHRPKSISNRKLSIDPLFVQMEWPDI